MKAKLKKPEKSLEFSVSYSSVLSYQEEMEEDRRQTDLGTAADIEEAQLAKSTSPPGAET